MHDPADDFRALRRRLSDAQARLGRVPTDRADGVARYMGRVYSGGSFPASVPSVFLTRPLTASADPETEGSPVVSSADPSVSVPVVVLGPAVPVVGDDLLAKLVDGHWVAGSGATTPTQSCNPCSIPTGNLHLTWTFQSSAGGTSSLTITLTYVPGPTGHPELAHWDSTFQSPTYYTTTDPCVGSEFGFFGLQTFTVACFSGHVALRHVFYQGVLGTGQVSECTHVDYLMTDSTYSCDPFSADWATGLSYADRRLILTT